MEGIKSKIVCTRCSASWFKKTVALDTSSESGKRVQQLLTQHNSQSTKQY